jgi:3-hydroxyisobutyrate dehydrogenase-like beta-hydroxyacid dehydrogenase
MTIGFIGLGKMGLPMAKNILEAGYTVHGYNRSSAKTDILKSFGAKVFDSAEAAIEEADIVITMLSDDAAVTEVSDKILPAMKKESIHLSMSTIAPATAVHLTMASAKYKVIYLSSPVMGRPPAAQAKQLFILLSGDSAAKQKVQPVLQAMSQRVFDYGIDPSAANTVKLTMNYMIFVTIEMLSEVMLLAEKSAIDKHLLLDTMSSTLFGSPVIKTYASLIIDEKDNPNGFATRLASKDLRLMQEAASKHAMTLPLAETIQPYFKEIIAQQGGEKDVSQLVSHLRKALAKN